MSSVDTSADPRGEGLEDFLFADVVPLPVDETGPQLAAIMYTDEYRRVFGLLRALMDRAEYLARALALTAAAIDLNAAHYTAWQYRFHIVVRTQRDVLEELDWCEQVATENLKNYQIWNYRQLVLQHGLDHGVAVGAHRELPLMAAVLDEDEKNYHVWLYRKWVVRTFGLFHDPAEWAFVDLMLERDVWNNLAWNHRFFLAVEGGLAIPAGRAVAEVDYIKRHMAHAPQNPLVWNYAEGVCRAASLPLSTFADVAAQYGNPSSVESVAAVAWAARLAPVDEANRLYTLLATEVDPVRRGYWNSQVV